eukprot:jgi/Tetstr1/448766/TSEL_036001.t1
MSSEQRQAGGEALIKGSRAVGRPSSAVGDRRAVGGASSARRIGPSNTGVSASGDGMQRLFLTRSASSLGPGERGGSGAAATAGGTSSGRIGRRVGSASMVRATSGRLRSLQARHSGATAGGGAEPAGVRGGAGGAGPPPLVPPAQHRFGVLGKGVEGGAGGARNMGAASMALGPSSAGAPRSALLAAAPAPSAAPPYARTHTPSARAGGRGGEELARAAAELEPAYQRIVPGLTPVSLSRDGVILCESASQPGQVYMQRTHAARSAHPDRLNLDRRGLD